MNSFKAIKLNKWRQFNHVDMDLSERLVVLTGPNGCGKTTVLNLLGRHFGWNHNLLASPYLTKRQKQLYADAWERESDDVNHRSVIGSLEYSGGGISRLSAPVSTSTQYQVQIDAQQHVNGLHIPSHRPPPSYAAVESIPINPKSSQEHYQVYQQFLFQSYGTQPRKNPSSAMKEALIAFAVFGEGNASVRSNSDYVNVMQRLQDVLSQMLPTQLGFQAIEVVAPDVVLHTSTGTFSLESMSGGLNAVFGIAWQILMHGDSPGSCTVLIDEPENHLHPSLQREFLPKLIAAFPDHRFIVATHSPFVVTSAPSAAVYALAYNNERKVESKRLVEADLAASPSKVLRDVLDVPVTMPVWVEKRIESVLGQFKNMVVDGDTVRLIREELAKQGLDSAIGDFIVERQSD